MDDKTAAIVSQIVTSLLKERRRTDKAIQYFYGDDYEAMMVDRGQFGKLGHDAGVTPIL